MSNAVVVTDMELEPAQLFWQPHSSTSSYYIGGTLKNVKVTFGYDKSPVKADQFGTSVLDQRVSGVHCKIATEVTQVRDFQLMSQLFPNLTLVGTTPYSGVAPSAAIRQGNAVGNSDLNVAGQLTLHPQNTATSNTYYDWTFFQVVATEATELSYSPTEQGTWKMEFMVYPVISSSGAVWFVYGNKNY